MDQSIEYGVNMSKLIDDVNAIDNSDEDIEDITDNEDIDDTEE